MIDSGAWTPASRGGPLYPLELGKRGRRRRASRAVLGSIGSVEPFFVVVPTCKEKLRLQKRKKGLPVSGTRGGILGQRRGGRQRGVNARAERKDEEDDGSERQQNRASRESPHNCVQNA